MCASLCVYVCESVSFYKQFLFLTHTLSVGVWGSRFWMLCWMSCSLLAGAWLWLSPPHLWVWWLQSEEVKRWILAAHTHTLDQRRTWGCGNNGEAPNFHIFWISFDLCELRFDICSLILSQKSCLKLRFWCFLWQRNFSQLLLCLKCQQKVEKTDLMLDV